MPDVRRSGTPVSDTGILNTGPKFFSAMQIPMLLGREIGERDGPDSAPVVVANERFTKIYFGHENPLGRRISLGGPHPRDMEIVAVSANVHYGPLKIDIRPVLYIPYNQGDYPGGQQMAYALRTAGGPLAWSGPCAKSCSRWMPACRC
jgi:hypothetical protein